MKMVNFIIGFFVGGIVGAFAVAVLKIGGDPDAEDREN